ncbi:MAG: sigma-70 family RNA polymerase sigma factor [Planctomycetes bacterium]|nr:sigma-70 family RNA polymerase sigma factor [Planctomycetota bacterium]
MSEPPDGRELMLAVAADRPGAFEDLVRAYEARVKAACKRSVRDVASVDDLAQEVFLRLFRSRHRYQPTARFETFLYRIIFNLCVNHTQFSNRRRTWSLDAPVGGADDEGAPSLPADERQGAPLELLEESERALLVREAVEELPDNQRRALLLSRFEGLGYEEIGAVMDLSLQAVKSLLWRARENLRRRLQPILGDNP